MIRVRTAHRSQHEKLVRLAATSEHTRAFSSARYSGPGAYERGWIRVAYYQHEVVGLSCVRHKVRSPETSLYFLVVRPAIWGTGVGKALLDDVKACSPNGRVVLNVMKVNERAVKFYLREGFKITGRRALGGRGYKMEWTR